MYGPYTSLQNVQFSFRPGFVLQPGCTKHQVFHFRHSVMAARAKPAGRSAVKKRLKRPAKEVKKLSSGCLTKVLKVYKGLDDFHLPLFKEVQKIAKARRILYPGSHWHLQASLVFPDVTYVDYNQKVAPFFEDSAVLAWVTANKSYPTEPKLKLCLTDFEHLKLPSQAFDLLISMSAGIVSKPCTRFLRIGGYFLVSDAHFDARTVALDKRFSLVGVYNMESKKLETKDLESCFMTTAGKITSQQVEVSKVKPKGSRGFKLLREDCFYLFKRIK